MVLFKTKGVRTITPKLKLMAPARKALLFCILKLRLHGIFWTNMSTQMMLAPTTHALRDQYTATCTTRGTFHTYPTNQAHEPPASIIVIDSSRRHHHCVTESDSFQVSSRVVVLRSAGHTGSVASCRSFHFPLGIKKVRIIMSEIETYDTSDQKDYS